jgi:hypothetical protein
MPIELRHGLRLLTTACVLIGAATTLHAAAATSTPVPAAPDNGGPRNWRAGQPVTVREGPSATAPALARFQSGTFLDNLGCERVGHEVWCDVQPLGGGIRGFAPARSLQPAIAPDGRVARGPDDSALRAGEGKFDENGKIRCTEYAGEPMRECEFGVARAGDGYATVVITKPDGDPRIIFFRLGQAIGVNTSQAEGYPEFSAKKKDKVSVIRVGDERYEVPDAVIMRAVMEG